MAYHSSFDTQTLLLSLLTIVVLGYAVFRSYTVLRNPESPKLRRFLWPAVTVLAAILFGIPLFIVPARYYVQQGELRMVPAVPVVVKKVNLDQVQCAFNFKGTMQGRREFGSGGIWGYYGHFDMPGYGTVYMMARKRADLIVLEIRGETPLAIDPDDIEGFTSELTASGIPVCHTSNITQR